MKLLFSFCCWMLCIVMGCRSSTNADYLPGKWKCIREGRSLSSKAGFEEYKRSVSFVGATFEFDKNDRVTIVHDNDTSKHYYSVTDNGRLLLIGAFSDVATIKKIIEIDNDNFKMAVNFDDTLLFKRVE